MPILFSGNAALNDIGQEYLEKLRKMYYQTILFYSHSAHVETFFFFPLKPVFHLHDITLVGSHLPEKPGKTMMGRRQVQSHTHQWKTRSEGWWQVWLRLSHRAEPHSPHLSFSDMFQSGRGLSCRNHMGGAQPIAAHSFSVFLKSFLKYHILYIKPAATLFP